MCYGMDNRNSILDRSSCFLISPHAVTSSGGPLNLLYHTYLEIFFLEIEVTGK